MRDAFRNAPSQKANAYLPFFGQLESLFASVTGDLDKNVQAIKRLQCEDGQKMCKVIATAQYGIMQLHEFVLKTNTLKEFKIRLNPDVRAFVVAAVVTPLTDAISKLSLNSLTNGISAFLNSFLSRQLETLSTRNSEVTANNLALNVLKYLNDGLTQVHDQCLSPMRDVISMDWMSSMAKLWFNK